MMVQNFYSNLAEFNRAYNTGSPFESWDEVAENFEVQRLDGDSALVTEEILCVRQ